MFCPLVDRFVDGFDCMFCEHKNEIGCNCEEDADNSDDDNAESDKEKTPC